MANGKFSAFLANLIRVGILILIGDLIYHLYLIAERLTEVNTQLAILIKIMKLLGRKIGVEL